MKTVEQIVEALGGRDRIAAERGITADAIRKWDLTGIPPKHWPWIMDNAHGEITWDDLRGTQKVAA